MSTDRDTARIVRSWLEEGATALPDRVLDAVIDQVPATRQRRPWWPTWRFAEMNNYTKLAMAAAAVLVVAFVGYNFLPSRGGLGAATTPPPTATPVPSASPMALPEGSLPGTLVPGSYLAGTPFSLKVGFTVPAGWQGNIGGPYFMAVERVQSGTGGITLSVLGNVYADPCSKTLPRASIGPSVDDLVTSLTHLKGVTATTAVDTTIAGHPAKAFSLTPSGSPERCQDGSLSIWQLPLGGVLDLLAGERLRLWVLTVGTTRLVVEVDEWATESSVAIAEVQAVLDSMSIAP